MKEFEGLRALVTGSSRGIGRHIAWALAEAGSDVAVHCRRDAVAAQEVAAGVQARGRRATIVQGDLTDPAAARRVVREAAEGLGGLELLVNNVGEFAYKETREHTDEEFDRIIRGTIGATHYVSVEALDIMRRQRFGRIVNLGAQGAERAAGRPRIGPHLAGKSAVVSWTRTVAVEEAPFGITVNCVNPGIVEDRDLTREEAVLRKDRLAPVGRPGTSQDIVEAVLFCLSPARSFLTGAVISVTGGWML